MPPASARVPGSGPPPGEWRGETLRDFTDQLIWPGLLRTPAIALSGGRLGLSFFCLIVIALLWELPGLWLDGPGPLAAAGERVTAAVLGFGEAAGLFPRGPDLHPFATAANDLLVRAPAALFVEHPWTSLLLIPPTLLVWCIAFGAIGRSAACEFAQAVLLPWPQALAFSLSRWGSLLSAVLAPLVLVAVIALVIAAGGAALLTWPGGDLIAALLSPLAVLLAAVAVLGLAGYLLGHKLIIPAVVCEGTDAIDAIQRTYAYVFGRPVLLIIYLLILGITAGLALIIASLLASGITGFTVATASHWAGPRGAAIMAHGPGLSGTARFASSVIRIALAIPAGLVAAYAISLYISGSTVLYLSLRHANDGQEPGELWMPGMIDGTMALDPAAEPGPAPSDDDDA